MVNQKLWIQRDRFGNAIYLTKERWEHITSGNHPEVEPYFSYLQETIRRGRRRQDPLIPNVYKYYRKYDDLPDGMNHVVVVVVFREIIDQNRKSRDNNFVVTAYFQFF